MKLAKLFLALALCFSTPLAAQTIAPASVSAIPPTGQCNKSAAVNVTAGNTTEVIAAVTGKTVRICALVITALVTGNAQVLNGAGVNCASFPVNMTGAMLLTAGTPLNISGSYLFTGFNNGAICVAAVTGNMVGFISYAQY